MTKLGQAQYLPDRIREELRRRIVAGQWVVGGKLPAERALAEEFAVSRLTVRQALEGLIQGGLIYRQPPNGTFVAKLQEGAPLAKAEPEDRTLGLMVGPELYESVFPAMVSGVAEECGTSGQNLLLRCGKVSARLERQGIEELLARQVAGVLMIPSGASVRNLELLVELARTVPLVLIDSEIAGLTCDFVGSDELAGTRLALAHLAQIGHRRIAHLCPPPAYSTARHRRRAIEQLRGEYGLDCDPQLIIDTGWDRNSAYAAIKTAWLSGRLEGVTALFCCSDRVAVGACNACREIGLNPPEDMAIVGYGNLPIAEAADLPLTTVDQLPEQVGQEAVRLLMAKLTGRRPQQACETCLVEPRLVLRESCGIRLNRRKLEKRMWVGQA